MLHFCVTFPPQNDQIFSQKGKNIAAFGATIFLVRVNTGILSCYKTNKILNSYPSKNQTIKPIKFPSLLSKRSIYAYNKNILNEISKKINISESLFHPITSLL